MRIPRTISIGAKNAFHLIWKMHNGSFLLKDKDSKRLYLRCIHDNLVEAFHNQEDSTLSNPKPAPRQSIHQVDGNDDVSKLRAEHRNKPNNIANNRLKTKKAKRKENRKNLKSTSSPKKHRKPNSGFDLHAYCIMGNHIHSMGALHSDVAPLSKHLKKTHSRFALILNKRLNRSGAVGNDRPKSIPVENAEGQIRLALYIFTNPVRAGIAKHPWDIKLRHMSSCRVFTHGEKTEFSAMIALPSWYLGLGKTPKERQAKFRELLRIYLIENGLMRDPQFSESLYIGSKMWGEKILASAKAYCHCRRMRKKKMETAVLI